MADSISSSNQDGDNHDGNVASWFTNLWSDAPEDASIPNTVLDTGMAAEPAPANESSTNTTETHDAYLTSDEILYLEEAIARVPSDGIDFEPAGLCQAVAPFTSSSKWSDSNIVLKTLTALPVWTGMGIHYGITYPIAGTMWANDHLGGQQPKVEAAQARLGTALQNLQAARGTDAEAMAQQDFADATDKLKSARKTQSAISGTLFTGEAFGLTAAGNYFFNRNNTVGDIATKLGWDEARQQSFAGKRGVSLTETKLMELGATGKTELSGRLAVRAWKKNWPLLVIGALAGTGLIENAEKGLDMVDAGLQKVNHLARWINPDSKLDLKLTGDKRDLAEGGVYSAMIGSALYTINRSATSGYRRISQVSPGFKGTPKATGAVAGALLAGAYLAQGWWGTNARAHEVIGPALKPEDYTGHDSWHGSWSHWNPMNWDSDFVQTHTTASNSIGWTLTGPLWASMMTWQGSWGDAFGGLMGRASEGLRKRNLPRIANITEFFNAQKIHLPFNEAENAWVATAKNKLGRGGRSILTAFKGKRLGFTANQFIVSYPLSVAIGELLNFSMGYRSVEANMGSTNKMFLTIPESAASQSYYLATQGYSTVWNAYWFNMLTTNNTWNICAQQEDNVVQSAAKIADDVVHAEDPLDRRENLLRLAYLYRVTQGDHRKRIGEMFLPENGIGEDPEAILREVDARQGR